MNDDTLTASPKGPMLHRRLRAGLLATVVSVLSACGGGGETPGAVPPPDSQPLHVGGNLSGLRTGATVLEITGGERLTLTADGPFTFQTPFRLGQTYQVTVVSRPAKTFLAMANAEGVVAGDVRNVDVSLAPGFVVGGSVGDLAAGERVVVELNGSERVAVDAVGSFVFSTLLRDGATYSVRLVEAPIIQRWRLSGDSGTIAGADVTTVAVFREAQRRIGGTVSGLVGGLILRNNGGDDLVVGGNGAFTFATRLAVGSTYDVRVLHAPASQRVTLRNARGTVGGSDVTDIEVVCADKAWTHPASIAGAISPEGDDADGIAIAAGAQGDAVIAWEYGSRIFISERRSRIWAFPVRNVTRPHNPEPGGSFDPCVAVDFHGNTLATWSQRDGVRNRIYASVYRNGIWRDPVNHADHLSVDALDAIHPLVAFDVTGRGYLVWEQYVNGNGRIFKAELQDGTWARPASVDDRLSPDTTHAQDVAIAVGPGGHVVVVWSQSDNHNYRIYKSERRNGAWTHPASLNDCISPAGADAYLPSVAFDGSDNAVIAWVQGDGAHTQIFKAEYRGNAWRYPTGLADNISPNGRPAHAVKVAMARNGEAVIVWRQDTGSASALFKSEYRAGAWTHPPDLNAGFSFGTPGEFAVAADSEGNTVVAYNSTTGGGTLVLLKSEYRRGVWMHATALSHRISPAGGDVTQPAIAIDGNDDVMIAWRQDDGNWNRAYLSEYR